MLEAFAIIGTYDELPVKLSKRCGGLFTTIVLDLPPQLRKDESKMREIIQALRRVYPSA
jgi:hypothetical protein